MKYILQYILCYYYVLYIRIINSFTPFIIKTNRIIKSLSGLLIKHIPYINNNNNNNDDIIKPNMVPKKILLVGYMEHDPKKEAFKTQIK